ncbi:MAG: hypothetical protein AMXMBFR58_21930 [Phycisphaerae bacterium]
MIRFHTWKTVLHAAIALAGAMLLSACASASRSEDAPDRDPRAVSVYRDGATPATWQEMVDACAAADAVLVGENHGHPMGLAAASALWEDILAKSSGSGTLALEFFERDEQVALDDYMNGVTDEEAFRKAARRTNSNYPPGHRSMVEAAKSAQRPVIAANAPRRYVRIARLDGYEKLQGLSPEQKRLFRIPDSLPTGHYRDAFNKIMTSEADHKDGEPEQTDFSHLDSSFRSQSLWDWTMAESVARALEARSGPVLLVIGRFHVDHEGGTVLALRQLSPGSEIKTVSFVNTDAPSDDDKNRADFVVFVGPGPETD